MEERLFLLFDDCIVFFYGPLRPVEWWTIPVSPALPTAKGRSPDGSVFRPIRCPSHCSTRVSERKVQHPKLNPKYKMILLWGKCYKGYDLMVWYHSDLYWLWLFFKIVWVYCVIPAKHLQWPQTSAQFQRNFNMKTQEPTKHHMWGFPNVFIVLA